ncbi:MAG: lysophospholipase [Acidobacteria bacterium]|nr:MAG: lysophospholipase [Acidobacteriota bacterium]
MRYLALGDSYTCGEQVSAGESWPVQLAALLRRHGAAVADPQIVARTGWTTSELSAGLDQAAPSGRFDLVSLLIGVNDQYRSGEVEAYRLGFRALLRRAVSYAGGDPGRVVVLSIPDWGATPFAEGRDRAKIAAEIDRFNAINRAETEQAGARYADITPVSRATRGPGPESNVAPDGLHPSAGMHAAWARLALPQALAALGRPSR